MHSFYSTHIFIVYNSVICTKSFKFYNGHIVLNYIANFVYSQSIELVWLYILDIGF